MSVFGIFFMKQFIQVALPREMIESARVEGAGEFYIYTHIAIPLSVTGIGVLSVYLWLNSWINYFWPLIMIRSSDLFTLPLGLATLYADQFNSDFGQLLAGSVIATIPLIVLFLFIQDSFIAGMTSGAVKDG
jgi:ABC-type glycerol-3-phosphate transport system permease component